MSVFLAFVSILVSTHIACNNTFDDPIKNGFVNTIALIILGVSQYYKGLADYESIR